MRLRAVGIIFPLALGILSAPLASDAQQPAKVPRLGYMSPGDVPPYDNAFLQGLQDQGYILPGEIPRYDAASWQGLVKQGYFEGKGFGSRSERPLDTSSVPRNWRLNWSA